MKTKALLIALSTAALALGAKAQSVTYGVRAGINFQNINGKDGAGNDLNTKLKTTINLGVNAEVPVAPDFYVQPGILFVTKGAKDKTYRKINYRLSYLEIPINLLYKPVLGNGKLLLGFGPYVAFAVGGSYTDANGNKTDYKFANKITLAQVTTPYAKRMDFGGNLLFGYELSSKLSVQLNAQLGMVKINPKIEGITDKSKAKNTGFGISVGYRF
jgi:hypothetical protein